MAHGNKERGKSMETSVRSKEMVHIKRRTGRKTVLFSITLAIQARVATNCLIQRTFRYYGKIAGESSAGMPGKLCQRWLEFL